MTYESVNPAYHDLNDVIQKNMLIQEIHPRKKLHFTFDERKSAQRPFSDDGNLDTEEGKISSHRSLRKKTNKTMKSE